MPQSTPFDPHFASASPSPFRSATRFGVHSAAYGEVPFSSKDVLDLNAEIAGVFALPELKMVFLNDLGRRRLDRELSLDLAHFTLPDLLGMSSGERFHSEMLPKARVLGRWEGEGELRDAWGSPFRAVLTLSSRREGSEEYLILHAKNSPFPAGNSHAYVADRELLHALMSSLPEAVYFKDRESRFLRISRAMAQRFNVKEPREVIGKTDFDYYSIQHASAALSDEQQILKSGSPRIEIEEEETWPDGRTTWVSSTKMPLRDDTGEIVGTFGISRDITLNKKLAKERQDLEMQLQLNSKLESIGRLAAGVAHEINTPTQYLSANTHFLEQAFAAFSTLISAQKSLQEVVKKSPLAADPSVRDALELVDSTAVKCEIDYLLKEVPVTVKQSMEGLDRVARIVKSLKDLCHPGAGEPIVTDLNRVVEGALTVCRHEWKYSAELATHLASDLPSIRCLADQIGQVVLNLAINAAHAIGESRARFKGTAPLGHITVTTKYYGDGYVMIEVQDDGLGIPADVRPRIFEPFFTTKPVGKGTGQGLALVKTIVETNHHGIIEVDTQIGTGTTFRILLPVNPPRPSESRVSSPPGSTAGGRPS